MMHLPSGAIAMFIGGLSLLDDMADEDLKDMAQMLAAVERIERDPRKCAIYRAIRGQIERAPAATHAVCGAA